RADRAQALLRLGRLAEAEEAVAEALALDAKLGVAYCRRGGGYDPTTNGWLVRAESRDGGWIWSEGVNSPFKNPNSAVDFIKLRSGNLLLVFNDNMNDRTPL
ncbi:MAG: exo-alpha-sialidase, partial [Actinomycetota bacterium]